MSNSNQRGNTVDRRRRKLFLLTRDGDGAEAPCSDCGETVDYETMVVDRIIAAVYGGRYTRDNIKIHCHTCSDRQGVEIRKVMRK